MYLSIVDFRCWSIAAYFSSNEWVFSSFKYFWAINAVHPSCFLTICSLSLVVSLMILPGCHYQSRERENVWSAISGMLLVASKLCVTGLCEGNPSVTCGLSSPMTCDAENVSIWWRHHVVKDVNDFCADGFLAAPKQLYEWSFPSTRLSVCLSVRPSAVTPFSLCSHHRIIMKFSGVITNDTVVKRTRVPAGYLVKMATDADVDSGRKGLSFNL